MTRGARSPGRKIVLLCEGSTEEFAVRHFLRPRLDKDGLGHVGLRTINLEAKFEDIFDLVPGFLKTPEVRAVFTLVDLYGLNRVPFPANATVTQKVAAARNWLRSRTTGVEADFFHPHLAVHDIEAWLLAEGASLSKRLGHTVKARGNAESIDFDKPPKIVVNELFQLHRKNSYRETIDGPLLYAKLDFDSVYKTCPYFRELYDDLKSIAASAL